MPKLIGPALLVALIAAVTGCDAAPGAVPAVAAASVDVWASVPVCPQPSQATAGDAARFDDIAASGDIDYGTVVHGTVTLAPQHHLWLAAYGPAIDRWYLLGDVPDQQSGPWTSMPIYLGDGSGADDGRYFCLAALAVDATTDAALRQIQRSPGTNWLTRLPVATAKVIPVRLRRGERPPSVGPSSALPVCPPLGSASGDDTVAFTSVHDLSPLDYRDRVTGRASLADGHHLWIMIYGPAVRRWYLMGDIVVPSTGAWTSMPLMIGDGGGSDDGRYFCLGAFAVNAAADSGLRQMQATQPPGDTASMTQPPPATAALIMIQLRHGER